jgi:N-acetylneuraminic acid mutarotase
LAPPLNAEIYDPASGQFGPAGSLRDARDTHAAVTLTDGRVLVLGGEAPPAIAGRSGVAVSSTEIFDPAIGQWTPGPALSPAFSGATVTLLGGGKVLIFGGQDEGGFPASAAALFE